MNEEKQIRYSKYLVISFALIAVLIIFSKLFCGGPPGNNNDIDRTISELKDNNQRAGEFIDNAGDEIANATNDISRAIGNAERAEGIANQNAGTIAECRELVSTIKDRTREAKSILADVERTNKEAEGR